MSEVVHHHIRWPLRFSLTAEGKLLVKNMETEHEEERPWYKDEKTGKPWMVKKARSFKGLVAMEDRDGEYDDMKVKAKG